MKMRKITIYIRNKVNAKQFQAAFTKITNISNMANILFQALTWKS